MARTRTSIEIDEDDVAAVMRRYGVRTVSEAVALALRSARVDPVDEQEFLALQGARAIAEVPTDTGPAARQV